MNDSDPVTKEVNDESPGRKLAIVESFSIEGKSETCQECGATLDEDDRVVVYMYQPAEDDDYTIGHFRCSVEEHDVQEEYTLGVRELVVEGRLAAAKSDDESAVVLDLTPLVVSPATTTAARYPRPDVAITDREKWTVELQLSVVITPSQGTIGAVDSDSLVQSLERWLRAGCTQLVQLAGQTVCRPPDRSRAIDKPSRPGLHARGTCADGGDTCPIFDAFEADDAPLRADPDRIRTDRQSVNRPSNGDSVAVDVRWRLHIEELSSLGLLTEGATLASSKRASNAIDEEITLHVRDVAIVNPLYSDSQRARTRDGETTPGMQAKDDLWRSELRPRSVAALEDRLGGLDEPISSAPIGPHETSSETDDQPSTNERRRGDWTMSFW